MYMYIYIYLVYINRYMYTCIYVYRYIERTVPTHKYKHRDFEAAAGGQAERAGRQEGADGQLLHRDGRGKLQPLWWPHWPFLEPLCGGATQSGLCLRSSAVLGTR